MEREWKRGKAYGGVGKSVENFCQAKLDIGFLLLDERYGGGYRFSSIFYRSSPKILNSNSL